MLHMDAAPVGVAFEGGVRENLHHLYTNSMYQITVKGHWRPVVYPKDLLTVVVKNSGI